MYTRFSADSELSTGCQLYAAWLTGTVTMKQEDLVNKKKSIFNSFYYSFFYKIYLSLFSSFIDITTPTNILRQDSAKAMLRKRWFSTVGSRNVSPHIVEGLMSYLNRFSPDLLKHAANFIDANVGGGLRGVNGVFGVV